MRILALLPLMGCIPERPALPADSGPIDEPAVQAEAAREPGPSVLIVLIDDLGAESVRGFGATDPLPTPALDGFTSQAVRFQRAYSAPVCSPTRAELLTGRWSHRSGVTTALDYRDLVHEGLPHTEITLAEALAPRGYTSAVAGKWHLGTVAGHGPRHPYASGFAHHRGSLSNLGPEGSATSASMTYTDWEKAIDGAVVGRSTTYASTDSADEALELMRTLPEPWFVLLAFNAPHAPWHAPPAELVAEPIQPGATVRNKFAAAVEAMDHELGRVLEEVDPGATWVVVLGDNGSPTEVVGDHGKATVFEGGVRVPLAIRGPGALVDHDVASLVAVVDLFPTVLGWADAPAVRTRLDGVDLRGLVSDPQAGPVRDLVYSGRSTPPGDPDPLGWARMVRDDRFKLTHTRVAYQSEAWGLYDLQSDPGEQRNLLDSPLTGPGLDTFEHLAAAYAQILSEGP